jgi:mRNA interferase HigB
MRVLGRKLLSGFGQRHADARSALSAWLQEVADADWHTTAELKQRYPHASFLPDNHVVFNIKGNRYRLEALVDFRTGVVIVKRVDTHADYSRW